MSHFRLLHWLPGMQRRAGRRQDRPRRFAARHCLPRLEELEDRSLLSTLTVVNTNDNGPGSLRYEVAQAGSGDTIVFAPSLDGQTITLTTGQLTIAQSLTIIGPGANQLTISGGNASRVFEIASGPVFVLSGLTITKGAADYGGGISNHGGTVTVSNCTITGNSASQEGGGIYNANVSPGTITITNCTITGNSAAAGGGGIFNYGGFFTGVVNSISITLDNSTVSDNSASPVGGGIVNSSAVMTILNSTVANNTATSAYGFGGGIYQSVDGILVISNSTVSGNSSTGRFGGLVAANNGAGTTTIHDSIIAGNVAPSNPDIFYIDMNGGSFDDQGRNLIGNTGGVGGFSPFDLLNVNPLLAPLGNYGGPTQTMALLPGSPAIDAGDNTNAPATDQRGLPRIVGGVIDIGAYESRGFTMALASGNNQQTVINTPFPSPLVVTVSSPYGEPVQGGEVTFQDPLNGSNGPKATYPGGSNTATINSSGQASVAVAANGTPGSYIVTALAGREVAPIDLGFNLTNLPVSGGLVPMQLFFPARIVALVNPGTAEPPDPCIVLDPQVVASSIIGSGATQSSNQNVNLQGQFAQKLAEGTETFNVVVHYQLKGSVQVSVTPPTATVATAASDSLTASYNLTGTMTEDVYAQGSTTPSWHINGAISSFTGNLSGILYPPTPVLPGSTLMSQRIDVTNYTQQIALTQTESPAAGGQAWQVTGTVNTTGNSSETFWPPEPTLTLSPPGPPDKESFSVRDQIQLHAAPLLSGGPGPATVIDAIFSGTGTLTDALVAPPTELTSSSNVLDLAGIEQLSGTIAPPPSSAAPGTGIPLSASDLFDLNPQPLPPG